MGKPDDEPPTAQPAPPPVFTDVSASLSVSPEGNPPPIFSEQGVQVHVMERAGRLHAFIEIGEDCTHTDLDRAIPLALQWRDWLLELQGPALEDGPGATTARVLIELDAMYQEGTSPARLAKVLNYGLAEFLQEAVKKMGRPPDGEHKAPFEVSIAWGLLALLGMPDSEAHAWLIDGLQRIYDGRPPFDDGDPITPQRVKDKLRTWRRSKKYRAWRGQL